MTKFVVEYKHNETGTILGIPVKKIGEAFVEKYSTINLEELSRISILYEVQKNYQMETNEDLSNYTLYAVADMEMSHVI